MPVLAGRLVGIFIRYLTTRALPDVFFHCSRFIQKHLRKNLCKVVDWLSSMVFLDGCLWKEQWMNVVAVRYLHWTPEIERNYLEPQIVLVFHFKTSFEPKWYVFWQNCSMCIRSLISSPLCWKASLCRCVSYLIFKYLCD